MGNNDVESFRHLLKTEAARLTELSNKWKHISDVTSIPEEARGHIRTTIGQAQLLMDQRFHQFESLVDDCEFQRGDKTVTCDDLQGFWDMIYFQVEDVNRRFSHLDELQKNKWIPEKQGPYMSPAKRAQLKKDPNHSTTKQGRGPSASHRDHVAEPHKHMQTGHLKRDSNHYHTNGQMKGKKLPFSDSSGT